MPSIDPLYPEDKDIPHFTEAFNIFAEEINSLIETAAQSDHSRYYNQVTEYYNVLMKGIDSPGFKEELNRKFNDIYQETINNQILIAYNNAVKYVDDQIKEVVGMFKRTNMFDQKMWKQSVTKILDGCLAIYQDSLLPGVAFRYETNAKRRELQTEVSTRLREKGAKLLNKMLPAFMDKADRKFQSRYAAILDEIGH